MRAAARWLTEAARQLATVRRAHGDLHRHAGQHPSPVVAAATARAAALRARLEADYRRRMCEADGGELKEPA